MEVIITDFYGVDDATAYENGLSYLAKKKDGLSGGSNETENKSNDFNVDLLHRHAKIRFVLTHK